MRVYAALWCSRSPKSLTPSAVENEPRTSACRSLPRRGGRAPGWTTAATEIGEAVLAVLFAFLSGGVILNVLKEELPKERASRFWAFAVGVAVYAVVLLAF